MCGEVGRVNQILIVLAHGSVIRGMLVWMFIPKPSSPYLGGDLTIYMSWVWMRNSSMDLSSVTNYYPISLLPFPPNLFKESTYLVSSSSFFFFFFWTHLIHAHFPITLLRLWLWSIRTSPLHDLNGLSLFVLTLPQMSCQILNQVIIHLMQSKNQTICSLLSDLISHHSFWPYPLRSRWLLIPSKICPESSSSLYRAFHVACFFFLKFSSPWDPCWWLYTFFVSKSETQGGYP